MNNEMALMEYSGYVTQLASGSEVNNIGIKMKVEDGQYIELQHLNITADNLGAVKAIATNLYDSNDAVIAQTRGSLDANFMTLNVIGLIEATTQIALAVGLPFMPFPLGAGMYIKVYCYDTLDFSKKLYFRCLYKSRGAGFLEMSVMGAGITLTQTSHKQIA